MLRILNPCKTSVTEMQSFQEVYDDKKRLKCRQIDRVAFICFNVAFALFTGTYVIVCMYMGAE